MVEQAILQKAVEALQACHQSQGRLVVLTGAGVSQESGIPTFRDAQTGLWANYKAEDLATREGFLSNPSMVWDWYDFRRNTVWNAQPNQGHFALAELENHFKRFTLITQNVDNLHQRAGSQRVLELHGTIFRYKCLDRNHPVSLALLADAQASPPICPTCNSWVRPDVVWFGEMLPEAVLNQAFTDAQEADVMIIAGTSGVVHPAASIPQVAKEAGATVIEVNPELSALTPFVVDHFLQGPSGEILQALLADFKSRVAVEASHGG